MFQSNELKVGFLALLAFLILYFGFNFLKGNDVFSTSNIYYVTYDNVDGLTSSNQVLVNGIEVGKVKKVELLPENGNKIKVTFRQLWLNVKLRVWVKPYWTSEVPNCPVRA